jgi:hypothetical protein
VNSIPPRHERGFKSDVGSENVSWISSSRNPENQGGCICLLEIGISSPDTHVISIDLAFGWHEPVPEHVLYCLGTCVLKTTGDEHEGT